MKGQSVSQLVNIIRNGRFGETTLKLFRDRVILAVLTVLAIVLVADPPQVLKSLIFMGDALVYMAPFFAMALAFAGFAKASGCDALIARAFSGNPMRAILAASLVGAISPFCSCGVIPLIAAMMASGVPLAPIMAFWIASPIMDPEMFVLTSAGIGTDFAIAKTIATFGMGLFAGFTTLVFVNRGYLQAPLKAELSTCGGCAPSFDASANTKIHWAFWRDPARLETFTGELATTGWFLGKWLTFAFLLESLMVAYVPNGWIVGALGESNALAVPLAVLVGIPSYLNGYAAIPLVSGLLELGMAPGAAMAFMTAGAVSSIPAAIAVFALVRKPVFAFYVVLGVIGATLSGFAFQISGAPI